MPRLPLCLPAPGENAVADEIRQRRHPRDLIDLDGILLHNPSIARGWNSMFGAIREKNSLPDDLRELLILRVAALNSAPYEWTQHEKVGRAAGLTTPQLMRIRDTIVLLRHSDPRSDRWSYQCSMPALFNAGLAFADSLTREVQVRDSTFEDLKNELQKHDKEINIDTAMLDATATVAGYNMVSRMLVGLEIGDNRTHFVDLPGLETRHEKFTMSDNTQLAVRYHFLGDRPTLMFCNSLLTNMNMWNWILPSLAQKHNLICFDQRGHGQSTVPEYPCTIGQLAEDVHEIVKQLGIATPLHGLIGVSQGGATVLEFSTRYPELFHRYIACDTRPRSSNQARRDWDERVKLASEKADGFQKLSKETLLRWFPRSSHLNQPHNQFSTCMRRMIEETSIEGFKVGVAALCDYEIDDSRIPDDDQHKVLLVSGQEDRELTHLMGRYSQTLRCFNKISKDVEHEIVWGAGHLPMVDQPLGFLDTIADFLGYEDKLN